MRVMVAVLALVFLAVIIRLLWGWFVRERDDDPWGDDPELQASLERLDAYWEPVEDFPAYAGEGGEPEWEERRIALEQAGALLPPGHYLEELPPAEPAEAIWRQQMYDGLAETREVVGERTDVFRAFWDGMDGLERELLLCWDARLRSERAWQELKDETARMCAEMAVAA